MSLAIADLFSVKGKIALVTGGARGIGLMFVRGLLANGAKVYIASRKKAVLDDAVKELSALGPCEAIVADLSEMAGVDAVEAALAARENALHILVNNAGATWGDSFAAFPEKGWDRTMDTNVKGVFFLIQKLLPQLRAAATANDPARVVNIGSISGFRSSPPQAYAYMASKAAVHHLTRVLASQLTTQHVTVNAIAPGMFHTDMLDPLVQSAPEDPRRLIPRGRFGGEEDAVGTLLYLCSRAGAFTSGAIVPLDGGQAATVAL